MLLTMNGLALLYGVQGKLAQAEELYNKVLEGQSRVLGEEHPDTVATMNNLAALFVEEGKNAEAERLSTKTVAIRRRVLGEDHPDTLRSVTTLGLASIHLGKNEEAEALLRTALEKYRKVSPDSWERYNCESVLGASLIGQRKYQEAERLVIGGYEGMVQRRATIPAGSRLAVNEAGRRIVRLYESWGHRDKARQWDRTHRSNLAAK
jgi:tetratricopeptide (TPR) repeat protein